MSMHAEMARAGRIEREIGVGNGLIHMYSRCGLESRSREVFDRMRAPDVVAWNTLLHGLSGHGIGSSSALDLFKRMKLQCCIPDARTFVAIFKGIGAIATAAGRGRGRGRGGRRREQDEAAVVQAEFFGREKLLENPAISCALIGMHLKLESISTAQEVLEKLPIRTAATWTALIAGYAELGHGLEALRSFERMEEEGIYPDPISFVAALKACGSVPACEKGLEIHAEIEKRGLISSNNGIATGNALLGMYVKCFPWITAKHVFDRLPAADVVTWNTLLTGYVEHGHGEDALERFEAMRENRVSPNAITYACVLKACASEGAAEAGCRVHEEVERRGLLGKDVGIGAALVNMYAKCGHLHQAREVFDRLPQDSDAVVAAWNALIEGFAENGSSGEAVEIYAEMRLKGISPDAVTYLYVLRACGSSGAIRMGRRIHAEIGSIGLVPLHPKIGAALVDMYAKCGQAQAAFRAFSELPVRNVVSWTALISGCVGHEHGSIASACFEHMQLEGISPNPVAIACFAASCASIPTQLACALGQQLASCGRSNSLDADSGCARSGLAQSGDARSGHARSDLAQSGFAQSGIARSGITQSADARSDITRSGIARSDSTRSGLARSDSTRSDITPYNSMVGMYSKHGLFRHAREVLGHIPHQDVVSWNALLAGYALHGHSREVFAGVEQMHARGISPDTMTFLSVLRACTEIGAGGKGQEAHAEMERRGLLSHDVVLGSTLVHMYGSLGKLAEAEYVFDKLGRRNVVSWNAILAGYARQGAIDGVLGLFEKMLQGDDDDDDGVEPDHVTFVVLLAACNHAGSFDRGQMYFEAMRKEHGIAPIVEHNACVVDRLARTGHLEEAMAAIVKESQVQPSAVFCHALLSSCDASGNGELGRRVFELARCSDASDAASYILMSKICANAA
jgi:pentatricopeptide repeat protein